MCKFIYSIGIQFADSRSLVIQSMQTQIQRLCDNKPMQLCFFAPYILQQISQTWIVKIKTLREAGFALAQSIIVSCFLYDTENSILYKMFTLVKAKQPAIRTKAAEFIHFLIQNINVSLLKTLLSELETVIENLITDAASDARDNGYKILMKFKTIAPTSFNEIFQTLSNAKIKTFYKANGINDIKQQ
eukprot:277278_1